MTGIEMIALLILVIAGLCAFNGHYIFATILILIAVGAVA
jgi:hypothetical protein